MFQGETAITVDDKGRVAIPTAYRESVMGECANRLVITYNPFESGCLWLFPHAGLAPRDRPKYILHRYMWYEPSGKGALD